MDAKTYIIQPVATYAVVTVRYYTNGTVGGKEQTFGSLKEALKFIEQEEAALTCADV